VRYWEFGETKKGGRDCITIAFVAHETAIKSEKKNPLKF
jgi:hypothetical protein